MAEPEHPANDEAAPAVSGTALSNIGCVAAQEGAETWRASEGSEQTSLREQGDDTTCCSAHQVSTWNRTLFDALLEVRLNGLKGMSLVSLPAVSGTKTDVLGAVRLAHVLLSTYDCITALDVNTDTLKGFETGFCDALRRNHSVRFLKIRMGDFASDTDIGSVICSVANLKELECSTNCVCPVQFWTALAKLLRTSDKLTALRIPNLRVIDTDCGVVLTALAANCSLEELSVHSSVVIYVLQEQHDIFVRFLANSNKLKKLSVLASYQNRQAQLAPMFRGLMTNAVLTELTLNNFVVDAKTADIMAEVLVRNHSLRVLNFSVWTLDALFAPQGHPAASSGTDFNLWASALVANKTLESVKLLLCMWESERWADLFNFISARSRPLKLIIKGHTMNYPFWKQLISMLRRSGIEDHVSFDTTLNLLEDRDIMEHKGFSRFYTDMFGDKSVLSQRFRQGPSLAHMTTAYLDISERLMEGTLIDDIVRYIATTSALKKLHLTFYPREHYPLAGDNRIDAAWALISKSLGRNTSINELHVYLNCITGAEIQLFADQLKSNQNVRTVHVLIRDPVAAAAFVRRLSDRIERNHNLLSVTMDDVEYRNSGTAHGWFAIWDTTRRNSDLVARAARFATGTTVDRYAAETLELIVEHPSLLQEVARILSIEDAEATALVRAKLRSVQSLDDFMRVTGVVKDHVTCFGSEDGCTQLDDLNEDCWSLVRRCLKVQDVRDPAAVDLAEDLPSNVAAPT